MGFNIVPSEFCSEHAFGIVCCFAVSVRVNCFACELRFCPACRSRGPLVVKVCRGNLQVLRNCRSIQSGRQRIDLGGNCKRIQRPGVQGTRLRQFGFGASFRWQPRAEYAGRLKEEQAAGCKLEELDSDLSNVVLCEEKGADCVILAPRAYK